MRIENIKIKGFRRFENETNIQLSGKLVAFTGPNEAGKTSALNAIRHMGNGTPIGAHEKTSFCAEEASIEISFFLDKEELEKAGFKQPTWLMYEKLENGKFQFAFRPPAKRSLSLRKSALLDVTRLKNSRSAKNILAENGVTIEDEVIDEIIILLSGDRKLSDEQIEQIRNVPDSIPETLESNKIPAYLKNLRTALFELIEFEENHAPSTEAFDAIKDRMPEFLYFSEADRNIQLPYDINLYGHENAQVRKSPSRPLGEIIKISGLNLDSLT